MSKVEFKEKSILIDGKKVQIISGAIHYFRVPAELWRDRLEKMSMCGLNCIETYMCWNLHEPEEGKYCFDGMLDFVKFIEIAQELGFYVIVRPGPFICAEWDNGGLPAWLMMKDGIEFRRMNTPYLEAVKKYYDVIMPMISKLQYDNGGPVIAVQVENEYGSYGHDREYIKTLRSYSSDNGITVPLFTADGGWDICIQGGIVDDSPMALTFGSRGLESFAIGRKYRPDDPAFCMEFWCGWFNHWGCGPHHTRDAASVADELDDMLHDNGNVNFYMFHGGTNFGFMSGANGFPNDKYTPDVTSYDYDGILSECGDATDKYFAVQNVIKKYRPDAKFSTPVPAKKSAYGKIYFEKSAELYGDAIDAVTETKTQLLTPVCMEKLKQSYGFINYRTVIDGPVKAELGLWSVRDRALIYIDGKHVFTYYRNDESCRTSVFEFRDGAVLDILVENMGRINYGPLIGRDTKGICDGVSLGNQYRFNWETSTLPMNDLSKIDFKDFKGVVEDRPAFYKAILEIPAESDDTFIKFPGVKGVVWVNGHNLGRYWNIGPGSTLYVPAPFLKKGANEIIVFELEKLNRPYVNFTDKPELG